MRNGSRTFKNRTCEQAVVELIEESSIEAIMAEENAKKINLQELIVSSLAMLC